MDKVFVPVNAAMGGVSRTIKAGYYKIGAADFLFHTNIRHAATAILIKYGTEYN